MFTLLCREKGINAVIVRGSILKDNTEKAYQWVNLYNQEEQKWYVVDVNQDNGDTDSSSFFMVGNNTVVDGVKVSDRLVANVKPYEEQNTTFKEPTVTSNSYEKFVVKVEYSTKETTKDTVIVTITANKEMKAIEGWTLSDDKKTLQGEFSKNVNGTVTLESTSGEKIDQQIVITNIDNNPPVLEVSYSTEKIASEVTATIKSDSELQPAEGWTLSADKKSLTKTYTKNTTETIKVYDTTSNFDTVKISINNIINGAPKCEISYSTKEQTRDDVIVTIKSDREIKEVSGWTLSEDKKSLTKTYTKNTKEDIKIEDLAGNETTAKINVDNISKEAPKLSISYNTKEPTNDKVKVSIKADKKLKKLDGWEISADEYTISKYYFENVTDTIDVQDLAGNSTTAKIEIKNIDKEKPTGKIEYTSEGNNVRVTIKANKELQAVNGWELSANKKEISKVYTTNKKETVELKDLAENAVDIAIEVSTINNNDDKFNNTNSSKDAINSGNTQQGLYGTITSLPKAGKISIVFALIVAIAISIIMYLKYKQYARISRHLKK